MGKFLTVVTSAILYGSFCYGTMPSQCFTLKHGVECQRVQLAALYDFREVNWPLVNGVRRLPN